MATLLTTTFAHGQLPDGNGEWPGFRGPAADGTTVASVFSDAGDFALDVAWKRPIGSGYSGIAVGAGVVVTMFSDGERDVVAAFDPHSGAERWRVPLGTTYRGHDGSFDGPTSTPLVYRDTVYALGPRGLLLAVDAASGTVTWSIDLTRELAANEPIYGFATSPLVEDDVLIVQIGAPEAAIAGFDPGTGELLWTAGDDAISYQSPVPMTIDGRRQVVAVGRSELLGLDAGSGEVLWRMRHGGSGFPGAESLVPVAAGEGRVFLAFKDDASTVVALNPDEPQEHGRRLWENRNIRNSYAVPVYHDGYLYGFSSRFLAVVDALTGEFAWKSRAPGDGFPMVVGDHVVIVSKEGGVHVIEASADGYNEIAAVEVFNDIAWSPPAFALGSVFARSMGELARIDVRTGVRVTDAPTYDAGTPPPSSDFAAFLDRLRASSDKAAAVDEYLAAQDSFPVVEAPDLVHFVYRGPGTDLALAGDLVGTRQEARMQRAAGTDLFYYSARLDPEARINYRFIRDYEEITDPRNPRTTGSAFYGEDMELSYDGSVRPMSWLGMPEWQPPPHLAEPGPETPRGEVVELSIDSAALGEKRTFQVYLPPGYEESGERYPVAYYHGGFAALPLGEIPKSLDNLIAAGQPPLIAVFMPPPPYTGLSIPDVDAYDRYARMWADEIVPLIDVRFRTIADPGARASLGGGAFGYFAAYAVFRHPDVATKLGMQSPAFNDWRRIVLESHVTDAGEQPLDVYLDWGSYDARSPQENWDNRDKNRRLTAFLRQHGYMPVGGEVADGTGWSSWKNRTDRVLATLFPPSRQ